MTKKLYYAAFTYGALGLSFGVFYREFTRFNDFQGVTQLSTLHTHTLVLGMFFFLIALILEKVFGISTALKNAQRMTQWFWLYNIALIGVLGTMTTRGILQVKGLDFPGLSHIAGTFHTLLGFAIIWFFIMLGSVIKKQSVN